MDLIEACVESLCYYKHETFTHTDAAMIPSSAPQQTAVQGEAGASSLWVARTRNRPALWSSSSRGR
jgi:hypothetical protein